AHGVDVMLIVIEPGQRSIDSTVRILGMAEEIGLKNIQLIANKIKHAEDEKFIQDAFPAHDIFSFIPYSDQILQSDRAGISVIDSLSEDLVNHFNNILQRLEKQSIK
ncbi:MAG: hypothetical protein KAI95_14435, partial [Bacteroidales bacterium]|nr:hypothetical protein [Bacteroidales bacterium]